MGITLKTVSTAPCSTMTKTIHARLTILSVSRFLAMPCASSSSVLAMRCLASTRPTVSSNLCWCSRSSSITFCICVTRSSLLNVRLPSVFSWAYISAMFCFSVASLKQLYNYYRCHHRRRHHDHYNNDNNSNNNNNNSNNYYYESVAALHQLVPGQMTWLEDPPPWLRPA